MIKKMGKKGFSLVETVTVLAIIAVFISFFYALLFLNWQACEGFLARADFGQDMDKIVDQIASDGRYAHQIKVTTNPNSVQASFTDAYGSLISTYTMSNNGQVTMARGANPPELMTEKLDFANSNFMIDTNGGQALIVNIAMTDQIFGNPVTLFSETEIDPRN